MFTADDPEPSAPTARAGWTAHLRRWAEWRRARSAKVERALLVVALVAFGAGLAVAILNLPDLALHSQWLLFAALAALCAVATLSINAVEVAASAHALDTRMPVAVALRTTVMASAANILPIPGGALMRARALRQQGQTYGRALSITIAVGIVWVAVASLVSGYLLLADGKQTLGISLVAAGGAGIGVAAIMFRRLLERSAGTALLRFIAIEATSVASTAARLQCLLTALDKPNWGHASALALTAIVASAAGLFPGGLGLRELLSAAIAGAVGLPASIGLLISALDRLLMMSLLALTAALLLASGARFGERQ